MNAQTLAADWQTNLRRLQRLFLAIVLILAVMLADLILVQGPLENAWLLWLSATIPVAMHLLGVYGVTIGADKVETLPQQGIGHYSAARIREIVSEVLKPHKGEEIPTIYIVKSKSPQAYAANFWLLDFIPRFNFLGISDICLHLMKEDELKAILSHEAAHFYTHLPITARAAWVIMLFVGIAPYWLYSHVGGGWLLYLFWAPALAFLLMGLIGSRIKGNRDQEFLCDLDAARRWGKTAMINALLMVGKGLETTESLLEKALRRVAEDNHLAMTDFPKIWTVVEAHMPSRLLTTGEDDTVIEAAFTSENMAALRRPLTEDEAKKKTTELAKKLKPYEKKRGFKVYDWSLFDFSVPDFRVSADEYPHLIATLKGQDDHQLTNWLADSVLVADSHPTLRERVLFLDANA